MTLTTALSDPAHREPTLLRLCGALLRAAPVTDATRAALKAALGTSDVDLNETLTQVQAQSDALTRQPDLGRLDLAGHLHVDAGCLVIGTPGGAHHATEGNWTLNPVLNDMDDQGVTVDQQHEAHWVKTGEGDGVYPLYVRRTAEGDVAELRVVFLPFDITGENTGEDAETDRAG